MSPPYEYQELAYVVLGTPKVDESINFYRDLMGLELSEHKPGEYACFRCSDYKTNLSLKYHHQAGLQRVGLRLKSRADLESARTFFAGKGYSISALPEAEAALYGVHDNFSVFEPVSGLTFDFFEAMIVPALPFQPTLTKIQRLGHVVIRTTNLEKTWQVLEQDFNFVPSDYVADKAVWMRCYPNPFHHSFAIVKEESDGLHHVNFMVSEIDDVGKARNRLLDAGVDIQFGPGRHKPSGSIFLYFNDPADMTMEFSFGMEEFPKENPREPRSLANSRHVMDLWGSLPKPAFAKGGEILAVEKP